MMYTNVKGYQIPNLSLPKAKKTNLNRYGRMRLDYLEQNEPNLCDQMMLEGTLLPSCRKMGLDAQQMFFVIDSRYRSRRPMIITTNLKLSELKNPPDLAHARIYDRILERCAPILFDGKNFREENAGVTRQAAKDIVNSKHD